MGQQRKRKAAESSSDSDDEVALSKIKKTNGAKQNNVKSGKSNVRAKKTSDDEPDALSTAEDSESEVEATRKSKNINERKRSGRSNKKESTPTDSGSRPKRNTETSKDSSKNVSLHRSVKDHQDEESSQGDRSDVDESEGNESPVKKLSTKREKKKKSKNASSNKEEEEEYEVDEILDFKIEDKRKYFLIRWKGYDSSADSWVYRNDLHCTGLIAQFYEAHPEARMSTAKRKKKQDFFDGKKKKLKTKAKSVALKIDEQPDYDPDALDENQEWKVEKILDVRYHRDKKRDFLIRWEGFSSKSDSWEPEENLDCKELIKKFTVKLEEIVNLNVKELRPFHKPTQRYTVMERAHGRRLSKRLDGRQRAQYYDCEE